MATRRRIGVSNASTEAARRQLMQPVQCWEKVWAIPENSSGANIKVYKWVKTEKTQQFSDDEGEVDEPLAPLPDEPEVVEGDEEMEQDETQPETVPLEDVTDLTATQEDGTPSKPPSPQPQLSISLQSSSELSIDQPSDTLDASLKPLDETIDVGIDLGEKENPADGMELDISGLGPDGLGLESSHDLSQMDSADALVGGQAMDQSADPFGEPVDG
ncbi:hypothetical protein Hypma_015737 [Hypsizygus marmoreus]|uniref:Uncharacterized protein n=1 Tax=Hypsizygus marmoreus TaxID=39966 RepID=A0A369K5A4_HYPMA|nr:hypothetical protein Hypma_015737 [Hypsizygus marmoreus]